jgi:hypothetical protein
MIRRTTSRLVFAGLASVAAVVAVGVGAVPAHAVPPTHEKIIVKDGTATIAPLTECPAPDTASIDLAFHDVFHLTFTDTTFHVHETQTGTFTSRSATGAVVATGHFTNSFSDQGSGAPKETFTSMINATGKATDGTQVRVHIAQHFTITPAGDVSVSFTKVSCG